MTTFYLGVVFNGCILYAILHFAKKKFSINSNFIIFFISYSVITILLFNIFYGTKFPDSNWLLYYADKFRELNFSDESNSLAIYFGANLLSIPPLIIVNDPFTAAFVSKFFLLMIFFYLKFNKLITNNLFVLSLFLPSLAIYSSFFLRETLILFICFVFLNEAIKKKFFIPILFLIILFFLRELQSFIFIIIILIYFFTPKNKLIIFSIYLIGIFIAINFSHHYFAILNYEIEVMHLEDGENNFDQFIKFDLFFLLKFFEGVIRSLIVIKPNEITSLKGLVYLLEAIILNLILFYLVVQNIKIKNYKIINIVVFYLIICGLYGLIISNTSTLHRYKISTNLPIILLAFNQTHQIKKNNVWRIRNN